MEWYGFKPQAFFNAGDAPLKPLDKLVHTAEDFLHHQEMLLHLRAKFLLCRRFKHAAHFLGWDAYPRGEARRQN